MFRGRRRHDTGFDAGAVEIRGAVIVGRAFGPVEQDLKDHSAAMAAKEEASVALPGFHLGSADGRPAEIALTVSGLIKDFGCQA
jgi:hypothetical protein